MPCAECGDQFRLLDAERDDRGNSSVLEASVKLRAADCKSSEAAPVPSSLTMVPTPLFLLAIVALVALLKRT